MAKFYFEALMQRAQGSMGEAGRNIFPREFSDMMQLLVEGLGGEGQSFG